MSGVNRKFFRDIGLNEIQISSQEAKKITSDTINGNDTIYRYLSEEVKNNLLSHAREDSAWSVLNSILIYNEIVSAGRSARLCRLVIVGLLIYIAYKVS